MLETWKDIVVETPALYVGWGGLLIGIVFGFVVNRTNFCTMGSVSDILSFGDYRRFRSWLLAIAVAIVGVAFLQKLEIVNTADSLYQTSQFGWGANIVGGLLFGVGMVFAGGCLSKNLVRAGGGDMRSLVVLVVTGIFGFMTIGGIIGPWRVAIFGPMTTDLSGIGLETQGLAEFLAYALGMPGDTVGLALLVIVTLGLLVYCFKDAGFRTSALHLYAGFGIGICVVAGWFLTGLAFSEFASDPSAPISLSFVRPTGDTLDYLMRYTALGAPGFGVVTLIGTLLGSFIAAISSRSFNLATFADSPDTYRNLFGAALMGIGGVLALGCTVGQGLSGLSTLAMGSIITFIFIIVGGIIGIKTMEHFA